jgi:ankyrin repeat protein
MPKRYLILLVLCFLVGCRKNINVYEAIRKGDLETVKLYVANGNPIDIQGEEGGYTPLMSAIIREQSEIAKYLISAGANTSLVADDNSNIVSLGASSNNLELMKLILKKNKEINHVDEYGFTPILYAARHANDKVLKLLLEQPGIKVNHQSMAGTSPLMYAAMHKEDECLKMLLEHGALVNLLSAKNKTALDYAIEYKSPENAKLLRKHGAKTAEELKK